MHAKALRTLVLLAALAAEASAFSTALPTLGLACRIGAMSTVRRSMRLQSKGSGVAMMAGAQNGRVDDSNLSFGKKVVKRFEEAVNEGMEVFVRFCPRPIMAVIGMILFWPTLWWNDLLKSKGKSKPGEPPRNWYDRVQPQIICGALPRAGLVPKLKEEGVTHVVNMVAEYSGPSKEYEKAGITQERFPVIDFTPPSLEIIEAASEYVHQVVSNGGTVYVHCKAGRGRAASVCMAYLIRYQNMRASEAQQQLQAKRPHILHVLDKRPVMLEFEKRYAPSSS